MPIEVTDGCSKNQCIKEYRIWSVATQKCLVLKKSNASLNVTCAGIGVEDGTGKQGSSKVVAVEVNDKGPNVIAWRFVFTLDNTKYALHVNNADNTLTAIEFSGDKPPPNAAYFVLSKIAGPFEVCVMGSDDRSKKCISVNMQDRSLTVKALEDTEQSEISFVISDADI